jgi:beta-lactam-binding protein with PASTA domain
MRSPEPPDLVAYTLEEAREILAAAGWREGDTVDTCSPRRTLVGPRRVVRQRVDEAGRIALVVCGERSEDARV